MADESNIKSSQGTAHMQASSTIDPGTMRLILTSDDILETLRHMLRGENPEVEMIEGEPVLKWKKFPEVKAMMNEKGIFYINTILHPLVQRTTTLSKLNDQERNKLGEKITNDVALAIWTLADEFELQEAYYDAVNDMILLFVIVTLNRALNAGERDLIGKTTSRSETVVQEREKKGWLSKLPI